MSWRPSSILPIKSFLYDSFVQELRQIADLVEKKDVLNTRSLEMLKSLLSGTRLRTV